MDPLDRVLNNQVITKIHALLENSDLDDHPKEALGPHVPKNLCYD